MRSSCFWLVLAVAVGLTGCSRLPDATYTLRFDFEKIDLPAKHKQQIAAFLDSFHGTPANPRMSLPADEEAPAEETAESSAATTVTPTTDDNPPITIPRIDKPGYDRLTLARGHAVYTAQCAGCHGTTGDGRGPAGQHLNPPPRDYRNGVFKFTSTPRGSKPRHDDLKRILKYGAKGTSMPAFRFLPEEDIEAVIKYVQVLSARGELEISLIREATDELLAEDDFDPEVVAEYVTEISESWDAANDEVVRAVTVEPPRTSETIQAGASHFAEMYCVKCHNRDARGSKTADVGIDVWGRIAYPADLSMGMLHGGRRPIDIYRRIYSGINGTPMPSSKDPDTTKNETPEERSQRIWELVHFVTAVIENNGVPAEEQAIIDDTIARLAQPPAPAAEEAEEPEADEAANPAKAASASAPPTDLVLSGAD